MKERVHWDEDQIESLAAAFVRLRSQNLFISYSQLLDQAQEECFIPDLRRSLASVNQVPYLKDRILALYAKAVNAEPPPPHIIEIPVEKPVDLTELYNNLDTPTLMALLTKRFGEVVDKIRFTNGSEPHVEQNATARAAKPSIGMFAPVPQEKKPLLPRVAFCHVELKVFSQLREEVERQKIAVVLRGVDIAKKGVAIQLSADFVVFMKNSIGGVAWKTALATWPRSRVFVVDNNVDSALQKMRDIVSLNIHIPPNVPATAQARA